MWSPRYLETKDSVLREYPEVGVVFSPYRVLPVGFWGWEMTLRQRILQHSLARQECFDNFRHLLRQNNVATLSSFVVRRTAMTSVPELFDSRSLFFDWWVLLYLSVSWQFYLDRESYVVWRQHRASAHRAVVSFPVK